MLEYFNLLNQLQEGIIVKTDSDEGYNILFANNEHWEYGNWFVDLEVDAAFHQIPAIEFSETQF